MTIIDSVSTEVLKAFWDGRGSVDLLTIFSEEGILLAPGIYGKTFCGRIEYHAAEKKFLVFYPMSDGSISPRTRFSLAHELGHYYLPHHNSALLAGAAHNSLPGFICDEEMEREADEFAASLLIPTEYLTGKMKNRSFMTLANIVAMAKEMQSSITAAAIRYCKFVDEACGVLLSKDGKVVFYLPSRKARLTGLGSAKHLQIPIKSATVLATKTPASGEILVQEGPASSWFPNGGSKAQVWEEALSLGYTGQTITLLAFEEPRSN
jgi:hypothetical protein